MNAPAAPIIVPDATPFTAAVNAVNAWRGRCMSSFAAVEAQVTETLVALAATDPAVTLPHLVGQRCGALSLALSRDGERSMEAARALAAWQTHDPLRSHLCHGVAKITMARDGKWQAVFTLAALRSRRLQRTFMLVDEDESVAIARTLHRDRQKLVARLKPLTCHLPGTEIPALRIGSPS